MPVRLVPPAGPAAATADGSRPAPGVPPPADVGVRMDGRLLTFRPIAAGGDEAREDRSADASTVVRVMAYVLVVIALNAMVLAYVSYEELETLELVPVPGPDNSTLTTVVEGPSNPVAVVGLAYYLALVVALAWSALGLARRRGWALTPSVVASVVSMGAFPVGTFIGPAVAFLLTRSAQREAMGLPATRPPRPRPYGDEAHGERRP